jgi:hypothetical protein
VFLSWKRGNKKENEGKTALFPYEKNITLNQELNMTCSIIKEKDKYESKYLSVSLREVCDLALLPYPQCFFFSVPRSCISRFALQLVILEPRRGEQTL